MRFRKLLFLLLLPVVGAAAVSAQPVDSLLRRQVAQMVIAGFRGFTASGDIVNEVRDLGVGGVIYFDRDVPAVTNNRNVQSPGQVSALSAQLQRLAADGGHPRLFVTVDQEGGRVSRLKARYGFPPSVSAAYQGRINRTDTAYKWASATAEMCAGTGINVDFAPCVDVDVDPKCPVIGALERSFSADTAVVSAMAEVWVDALHERGILSSLKHFPGHGSSQADSHLGLVDITSTWQRERELAPYRALFGRGYADFVMVGHLMHRGVDGTYPASLSRRWITDVLRGELGYRGLVITDDLNMGAIVDHYTLERALELAINAGVDMVILGNNGPKYEAGLTPRAIDTICRLVGEGRIPRERIAEAYGRIQSLKGRL